MSSVCSFVVDKFSLNESQEILNESQDSPEELKRSISFQKSNKSYTELNSIKEKDEPKRNYNYAARHIQPSLLTGIKPTNRTITVVCFPTDKIQRKIILLSEDAEGKNLISYLVTLYFQTYLNFQPHQIDPDTFQLKKEPTDPNQLNAPLDQLYQYDKMYLLRKPRSRIEPQKYKPIDERYEPVEILVDRKHNSVIEYIQKGKNGMDLKTKANQYRRFSKIHLLYYMSMKFVDPKKKISQMPEKVFEIYRENITHFQDKTFIKFRDSSQEERFSGISDNVDAELPNRFFVNSSLIKGKLYIEIKDNSIIQYREGSIINLIERINSLLQIPLFPSNPVKRSIMNLVSATKSTPNRVDLEFMYAQDSKQVSYYFDSPENAELMMINLQNKEKVLRVRICKE